MYDYATCVVAKRAQQASQALLLNVDNSTIIKRYPALIDGACLGRQIIGTTKMQFGGDLYRYALADALVAREFRSLPAPDLTAVPHRRIVVKAPEPLAANATKAVRRDYEAKVKAYDNAIGFAYLANYGECVVRVDPAMAKALLDARPNAPEEAPRFTALVPALQRCMAEGQTMEFGKVALRGTIALNYYRLAHAALGR